MKKLLILALLLSAAVVYAATNQPNNIGYVTTDGPLGLWPRTLAQLDALTPDTTNQLAVCSDCKFKLCISTGAQSLATGAWVITASTVPAASSGNTQPLHCQ